MGRVGTALIASVVWIGGCSRGVAGPGPSLNDMTSAAPILQAAARSVVLVTMPGFTATGSFISPDGLLLTNNHVLGVGVCPIEGCYAELTWSLQRGEPRPQPVSVFLVPKAIDVGLDMAVLQARPQPGAAPLSTPSYLTIDARDPASLQGTHVTVVGHPEGSIKKWSEGEVIDSDGTWITTNAFILPGDSGSPLLDDRGHLVGLMHRSPAGEDLATVGGLNASSIGTASSALIGALGEPLPASMWSVTGPATDAEVVAHHLAYLAARTPNAVVAGAPKPVLASLGEACDAALATKDYASPDDLDNGLAPCFDAELWIDCRYDSRAPYRVCPPDAAAWRTRYQVIFEYWRAFNGELQLDQVSFAQAALSSSMASGRADGEPLLRQALAEAQPPLDFHVAEHLAAFAIGTYRNVSVVAFLHDYARVPDYAANGRELASAILWFRYWGAIDAGDEKSLLAGLHDDRTIDLGTRLFIELAEYNRGILP